MARNIRAEIQARRPQVTVIKNRAVPITTRDIICPACRHVIQPVAEPDGKTYYRCCGSTFSARSV